MKKMSKQKIFVVDDHLVVREGLKLIFETEENYEVVGEAENGEEALVLLDQSKPDVILMDLNMPKMSGIEVIKALNKRQSAISLVNVIRRLNYDSRYFSNQLGAYP